MFHSARVRLTLLYLVIAAFISICFSAIIYTQVVWELEEGFKIAEFRLRGQPIPRSTVKILLEEELKEAKRAVKLRLFIINGIIIASSGVAGYFLAGKTLRPIETMVEEQKRFIADASHELRTPLTSLRSEIEVAMRNKAIQKNEVTKTFKSNLEEVDKMQNLINYLLSLSRYENTKIKVLKEKVNLGQIAKKTTEKLKKITVQKGLKLKIQLKDIYIQGNMTSIEELLTILLDNAIKYTPKGGEVTLKVYSKQKRAVIEVIDSGIGIKSSDIPHIFSRFYRADTSRSKTQIDGYGLGLSIAKSIVEMHHGAIHVESKVDKGTFFKITIPLFL